MANRTVTVTVASGTLYIVGGTGNSYFLDGSRPGDFTVDWVKGGTIRFDQSGSSNDGHPLIFSTSNHTDVVEVRAAIVSSGVTYYLDGASNQTDYTNTTNFNAATTRYIEIAPTSQTDFYFACWVHGIGMGGIMDITQDTFGALGWGDNSWSSSNNLIDVTGQALPTALGTVEAFNLIGWGRLGFGDNEWGDSGLTVDVSATAQAPLALGLASVSVTAELNSGWGRAGWGDDGWGIQGDVLLTGFGLNAGLGTLTVTTDVTQGWGRQSWGDGVWGKPGTVADSGSFALAATLGTETVTGNGLVIPTGISLTTTLGDEEAKADVVVSVTGQSLTLSTGSISMVLGVPVTGQSLTTYIGKGWGAGAWNSGVWGGLIDVSIGADVIPTGLVLTTAIGTETIKADADITLTALSSLSLSIGTETIAIGQIVIPTGIALASDIGTVTIDNEVRHGWGRLGWGMGGWNQEADGTYSVTGIALTSALGTVDAVSVVEVTGIGLTTYLGDETISADALVTPTGLALTPSIGTVTIEFRYLVTGVSVTASVGTAVAGASAQAPVTGQFMTTSLGTLSATVWTEIDPGVSMVWTEIAA